MTVRGCGPGLLAGQRDSADQEVTPLTEDSCQPVSVSRRIDAPAEVLFAVLADPARHPGIDGSGMVRKAHGTSVIAGVGTVFTMSMHNDELGDYEITKPCRRVHPQPADRLGAGPQRRVTSRGPGGHR